MTKKKNKDENQPQEIKVRDAVFHPEFREDLTYWVDTNRKTVLRALNLVEAIMRDPFTGMGKVWMSH
ncbi:MAG: type II toxin-antitoxin system YoeB family toxin [Calothrix sp. MO_167.B12]|nr:type II toxin-antitoxin system YoeB family toxin [Calothrix sp. MO_167.B12]